MIFYIPKYELRAHSKCWWMLIKYKNMSNAEMAHIMRNDVYM